MQFCERCNADHKEKFGINHVSLPIKYYSLVKDGKSFSELDRDYSETQAAIKQARAPLEAIDQFAMSLSSEFQQLYSDLSHIEGELTANLAALRSKAESEFKLVVFELEKHSPRNRYQSPIPLVNALRGSNSSFISLFTHNDVSLSAISAAVQRSVTFNYMSVHDVHISAVEVEILPLFKQNQHMRVMLKKFFLPEMKSELYDRSNISVDHETAYCFSTPGALYCVGGCHNGRQVLRVNVCNEECVRCPHMSTGRALPGVCVVASSLMVFGGRSSETLNSCEAMTLSREQWEPLPNMVYRRCGFNPVHRTNSVYLIGGESSTGRIERFDTRSGVIEQLPVVLPLQKYTTSFLVNGDILILQNNYQIVLTPAETLTVISDTESDVRRWSPIVVCWEGYYYYNRGTAGETTEIYKLGIAARRPEKVKDITFN